MSFTDLLSAVGAVLAGIGLIYAAHQVRLARKTARAQFLMQLDGMFQVHASISDRLRTDWVPDTVADWIAIENYMLLFEHVQLLIEDGIVDLKTFDRLYGYRLLYIVANPTIREHKLEERKNQWVHFITLWRSIEKVGRDHQMYSPSTLLGSLTRRQTV